VVVILCCIFNVVNLELNEHSKSFAPSLCENKLLIATDFMPLRSV
jgi:hypothetical protein